MIWLKVKSNAKIAIATASVGLLFTALCVCYGADNPAVYQEAFKYGTLDHSAYDLTQNLPFGYVLLRRLYAQDPNNSFYEDRPIGFIARSSTQPVDIVVAFRGTENSFRWLQSAHFELTKSTVFPGSGLISDKFEGFYRAARTDNQPAESIIEAVQDIKHQENVSSIHLVGHGFGAIFAELLALDLVNHGSPNNLYVYTFSSPRLGDLAFSQVYNHFVPNTWRVHNRLDIITKTPPPLFFFHVGNEVEVIGNSRFDLVCESDLSTYLNALDSREPLIKECVKIDTKNSQTTISPGRPEQTFFSRFSKLYLQAKQYWPVTALLSMMVTAITGIAAVLLLAWAGGAPGVSKNWLIKKASTLLLAVPGLGRWALFLGYNKRLLATKSVKAATVMYFGIPAATSSGNTIPADLDGDSLHRAIIETLGPQQPVLVVGSGGAGKSTLLARLAYLASKKMLLSPLQDYTPVLVPAGYYTDSLIKAVTAVLRGRDGVGLTEEMTIAQLQTGKFLILFDGLTEVGADDKVASTAEIFRTAENSDYSLSRFIISTRSSDGIPPDVQSFRLQPLAWSSISAVISRYEMGIARENQLAAQLGSMTAQPISPLLLNMTISVLRDDRVNQTINSRANLYEAYCRRLLKVESDKRSWNGWRTGLEQVARWSLIETGKRGVGLAHVALVNNLEGRHPEVSQGEVAEDIAKDLKRLYGLQIEQTIQLLQALEDSGILVGGRRWRFVHDTFEEYFAASYLLSELIVASRWPELTLWTETPERQQDFLGVIDFLREMADDSDKSTLLSLPISEVWKQEISR